MPVWITTAHDTATDRRTMAVAHDTVSLTGSGRNSVRRLWRALVREVHAGFIDKTEACSIIESYARRVRAIDRASWPTTTTRIEGDGLAGAHVGDEP